MQRGALIQHSPSFVAMDEILGGVVLDYIDPRALDSAGCVDLMLGGGYDFVMPCLTLPSLLAFRLAEVAHVANLDTRVIMYTASPDPRMLCLFDGLLGKELFDYGVRTFAETMARPPLRYRTPSDVDAALAESLTTARMVRVGNRTEARPAPTLGDYRDLHFELPWRAVAELAGAPRIHSHTSRRRSHGSPRRMRRPIRPLQQVGYGYMS